VRSGRCALHTLLLIIQFIPQQETDGRLDRGQRKGRTARGRIEGAWKEATHDANEMNQVEAADVDSGSNDDEGTAVIGHIGVVTIPPLRRASTIPDLFSRSQRNPLRSRTFLPSHLYHLFPSCARCHSAASKPSHSLTDYRRLGKRHGNYSTYPYLNILPRRFNEPLLLEKSTLAITIYRN